ncbi:response regulator [Haliangium sp.]|uniref:response regulator n=1 Tax=Haliangium sp. TaxID=2663208 RepID=UPI003D1148BC
MKISECLPEPSTAERTKVRVSPHVLVVDDNACNQTVARYYLESFDCDVTVLDNGLQAVDAVRQMHFDVILMDCDMPVLDGYEATKRIRQTEVPGRHIPIIATTAQDPRLARPTCEAAGMDDFIEKPLTKDELWALVSRWIAVH